MSNLFQRKSRVLKDGRGGKVKQVRVKPYLEETWMTENEVSRRPDSDCKCKCNALTQNTAEG